MLLEDLKRETETDDIIFSYNNKSYVICLLGEKYNAGESGNDEDDNSFDTFEEMANKWNIEGKKLKDIVNDIKLL